MKILLIGPGCGVPIPPKGWGGIEKVIWKHSDYLRKQGHEVDILNERNSSKLSSLLKNNYDIVHAHEEWGLAELKKTNIEFVYTCHSGGWLFSLGFIDKLFQNVPHSMVFEQMYNHPDLHMGNKYSIYNGAEASVFYPEEKKKKKCIAIGLNDPRKKFDKIAEIISKNPDYEIYFIGPKCETLKISDNIKTIPNLSEEELAKHIRDAEYFFHLAEAEADALAVKEACMSGCKMILSEYCSKTVGEDISWTDVENFFDCPDDLGERARERAIEKYSWETIGKQVEDHYKEIIKKNNNEFNLGFYLQVFKNSPAPEFTLKNLRKFYPDNKVYLVSDCGDDFSELAKKYNCEYEYSNINTGVRPVGFNKDEMLEWLRRMKSCFEYCSNSDYIVYLEDDLIVRNKIKVNEKYHICGVVENPIHEELVSYIKSKRDNCNFNSPKYGACGGTIYNRNTFLEIYDDIVDFINNDFDYILQNISKQLAFLDCAMPVFYMMNGYKYKINKDLVETDRGHNWILSKHALVHVQSDDLLEKIISGKHRYE